MEGKGHYHWSDNRDFVGEFKKGKKNGLGRYLWPDGRSYTGFWENGKQHGLGKYKETKFVGDNFFYDISFNYFAMQHAGDDPYYVTNSLYSADFSERVRLIAFEEAKKNVEKYQKKAKDNPDKAYFLMIQPRVDIGIIANDPVSLLVMTVESSLYVCDKKEQEKVWEDLLSCFRYYNLMMYGSAYSYMSRTRKLRCFSHA